LNGWRTDEFSAYRKIPRDVFKAAAGEDAAEEAEVRSPAVTLY
jgi:hypothetical protein